MEKYMKRYFVLGLIIWSSFDIGAMEAEYNRISVPDCQMELDGDSVRLTMTIDIENVKVSTNHSVEYTPVLISYEHGEDSVAKLPKILLKGRMEYKAYQRYVSSKEYRKVALKEQKEQYFLVLKGYGPEKQRTVQYSAVLPAQEWMRNARLELRGDDCGCGKVLALKRGELVLDIVDNTLPLIAENIRENDIISERAAMTVAQEISQKEKFVQPFSKSDIIRDKEKLANGEVANSLLIYFPWNSAKVDSGYMNNREVCAKIIDIINKLNAADDSKVVKVLIGGFASIEGKYDYNKQLAANRIQGLCDFLKENTAIQDEQLELYNGGGNWSELRTMILKSDISYKREVLDIIDHINIKDGRERKLMDLKSGKPYRYIKEHFFPKLRYAGYIKVYYELNKQ